MPDVIDALVAALQPLKADGVFILDGPLPQWPKTDAVVVGYGLNESMAQDLGPADRMADFYDEASRVTCSAYSWRDAPTDEGELAGAVKLRRDRVVVLLQAVRDVLDADETLGGVCDDAKLDSQLAWGQVSDGQGPRVAVGFSVVATKTI